MNVQNIPRKDKVIKTAFVPKLDIFMFFDYKQIELRLLAFYLDSIGDDTMAEVFRGGLDLHTETACSLFNTQDPTDEQRQIGKTLNFSIVYGGGRPTVMAQLGVSSSEAGALLRSFHRRWPGIKALQETIHQVYEQRGYIKTLWGRQLHPESPHKEMNALIQGCGADLIRSATVRVHDELEGYVSHTVNIVHDELMLDVAIREAKDISTLVPMCMIPDVVDRVLPVEVDVEWSGTTWADKRSWKEFDDGSNVRRHDPGTRVQSHLPLRV